MNVFYLISSFPVQENKYSRYDPITTEKNGNGYDRTNIETTATKNQKNKHVDNIEEPRLRQECVKRAYLDGRFFAPQFDQITGDSILAECQNS